MMALSLPVDLTNTRTIVDRQLAVWPEHETFLSRSFAERDDASLALTEDVAAQIMTLAGDNLDSYCNGYRWMCDAMLQEELFFRRHGRYQAQSFADVSKAIYDDRRIMRLYMDGLLLSQVFWRNHVDIAKFFRAFIDRLPQGFDLLEIGPGHGLQLAYAASNAKCASATAWDISDASLTAARECVSRLSIAKPIAFEKRSIFDARADQRFNAIVLSEVLEHLEDPAAALSAVRECMRDDAIAFINVPCNSPAPDHIYLFSDPGAFYAMVEAAGYRIVDRYATPGTGWTLDRAIRQKLTVSCAVIAMRDNGR